MKRNSSNRKYNSGFTLVELIVVIAILAILAGVGAVGYGAYIEYANKGVDRQTVGEIIHALEIADYADPTLFGDNPSGTVLLSSNGAVGTTPAIQKALADAGIDATLSYEKWPGAIEAKAAANLVNTALGELTFLDGEVNLTYAGVATQSWDAVKDAVGKVTAILNSGEFGTQGGDIERNAPALVLAAAKAASNSSASLDWVNFKPSADNKTESLPSIVARNYSFAEYLRQNYNYDGMEKDIEDLQNVVATFNSLMTDYTDPFTDSSNAYLYTAAQAYLNTTVVEKGTTKLSQAQIDNQGYNQMMKSMYDQYGSQLKERIEDGKTYYEFTGNASTFWDEAGGILSTAGQMAQMTTDEREEFISKLPDEGTAIQVVILGRGADGTLNVSAIPADAMPKETESTGDGGCSHTHTTGTVTLNYSRKSYLTCDTSNIILCNTAGVTSIQFDVKNYTNDSGGVIDSFSTYYSDLTISWEGNEDSIVTLDGNGTLTATSVSEVRKVTLSIKHRQIANPLVISITIYP